MTTTVNSSAFPLHDRSEGGMTLRDYFAAAALAGLLADPARNGAWTQYAEDAYDLADAMLAERAKGGK